ncbi:hypothetical protein DASB73_037850 [Starmerella bacillaris]|uniref:Uncharacterized protein n=1 Tax=Starmerella bacillaris TaxID=1247836 RepID=A0AAV5RPH7_STABA|nr:hypothetical protein DASB73_037850 [Starmerella bacillaris]
MYRPPNPIRTRHSYIDIVPSPSSIDLPSTYAANKVRFHERCSNLRSVPQLSAPDFINHCSESSDSEPEQNQTTTSDDLFAEDLGQGDILWVDPVFFPGKIPLQGRRRLIDLQVRSAAMNGTLDDPENLEKLSKLAKIGRLERNPVKFTDSSGNSTTKPRQRKYKQIQTLTDEEFIKVKPRMPKTVPSYPSCECKQIRTALKYKDVVFEDDLLQSQLNWTDTEIKNQRKVLPLGFNRSDDAISIFVSEEEPEFELSLILLPHEPENKIIMTFYDIARLIEFIFNIQRVGAFCTHLKRCLLSLGCPVLPKGDPIWERISLLSRPHASWGAHVTMIVPFTQMIETFKLVLTRSGVNVVQL